MSIDHTRFESVVAGLREGAQVEFERGYGSGPELAELVGFDGVGWIVTCDGIAEAIPIMATFDEGEAGRPWLVKYSEEWSEGDPLYEAFRTGAERAIADLWAALRRDDWGHGSAKAVPDEAAAEEPGE